MKFDIKHILIPVDFSETSRLALDHAVYMAKLYNADITLLHVQETAVYTSAIDYSVMPVSLEYEQALENSAKEQLRKMAEDIQATSGVTAMYRVVTDRIYTGIIETAADIKADIILMGTHGVSGFQEFFLGSNTYRVISESPCPLLSLQESSKKMGFERIVLPIDNSPASRQKVPAAAEIAKQYGSKIYVAQLQTSTDDDYLNAINVKVKQVEEFLTQHSIPYETSVLKGSNIATLTQDFAKRVNADLIIIMTEQESNIMGAFLGPFAQQLVNHSKTPVLTIRPDHHFEAKLDAAYPLFPG